MKKFTLILLACFAIFQLSSGQHFDKKFDFTGGSKTCAILSSGTRIVAFNNITPFGNKLVAFNPNGDTLWVKEYGYYNGTSIDVVRSGPNDQILLVGLSGYSGTYNSYYPFFAVLDSSGNLQNYQHWQSSQVSQTTKNFDAHFAADGSIYWTGWYMDLFSGGVSYFEWHVPMIAKFNSNLTLAWSRQYGNHAYANRKKGYAYEMEMAPDGNMIVWGTYDKYSTPGKYFITKINSSNGSRIWSKDWPNDGLGTPSGLAVASNGDIFAVQPSSNSTFNNCVLVHKFDNAGNYQWSNNYGNAAETHTPTFAMINAAQQLCITGQVDNTGNKSAMLVKTDLNGTVVSGFKFGSGADINMQEMLEDGSGKYFFTGTNSSQAEILQIDATGNSLCGSSAMTISVLLDTIVPVTGTSTTSSNAGLSTKSRTPATPKLVFSDTVYCYVGPSCSVTATDSINGDTLICPTDSVELFASGGTIFQWMMNGSNIAGATSASYFASTSGNYQAIVSDGSCADTSAGINILAQPVSPTWIDLVNSSQSNDTLFNTAGSNGWGNSGAASFQLLDPNTDGSISHVIHSTKYIYYIGFTHDNQSASQLTMDHAFYFYKKKLRVRERTGTDLNLGMVNIGDTLEISREGSMMVWKVNGSTVHSTAVDPSLALVADVTNYKANTYITHTWLTFCNTDLPFSISSDFADNVCATGPSGSAIVVPKGGVPPYSYLWSTGDTTSSITGLNGGNYSVTVNDNDGNMASMNFNLLNKISWTETVGSIGMTDTLSKTGNTSGWGNAGARSVEVLQPNTDGSFTHIVHRTDKYYFIGLSNDNPDEYQTTIDFAFYNAKGQLQIREQSGFTATYGALAPGDTLKIERMGSTINYWQNSTLVRTTSVTQSWPLFVDVALHSRKTVIWNVYSSFCSDSLAPDTLEAEAMINHEDCFTGNGGASLMVSGGVSPYTYSWSSGETVSSISGKVSGAYTCTVTDQVGGQMVIQLEIMNKVIWEGFIGSAANGDTVSNTNSSNGWGTSGARSDNKLLNGTSGKMIHIVHTLAKNYYLGLSDSDPDASQFTIDYAFYNNKGNLYIREEQTGHFQNYGTVVLGDTLEIERSVASMYYRLNGSLLRSIGVATTETLRVDLTMSHAGMSLYDVYVDFCDTIPGQKAESFGNGNDELALNNWEGGFKVWPNPAKEQVNVWIEEAQAGQKIQLLSLRGRIIREQDLNPGENQLDVSGLAAGMYLLKVNSKTLKFIKE